MQNRFGSSRAPWELKEGAKQYFAELAKSIPFIGGRLKGKNKLNPISSPGNRFESSGKLLNDLIGSASLNNKDTRKILNDLTLTKPSFKRKIWHGAKGGFRGLLVAGALAALQRGLGRSDTRFLDSDVDILKDLQDNTNK